MNLKDVSCGWRHTALLSEDGRVFTLGSNSRRQLGRDLVSKSNTRATTCSLEYDCEPLVAVEQEAQVERGLAVRRIECGAFCTILYTS